MCISICFFISGCHRTKYHHLEDLPGVSLRIEFDWNGYTDIPPGMNLIFYPIQDNENSVARQPITMQLQYDGGEVSLPVGSYNVAIFNDYTYDILYRGMDHFFTAEAYLAEENRMPLASRFSATRNVAAPDILYVTQIRNLQIEPTDEDRIITVYPELMTLTLYVHVRGEGLQFVKKAEGGISGVAGSIALSTGLSADEHTSNNLFPFDVRPQELYATTRAFLMADRLNTDYMLDMAFLLQNNSMVMDKYSYDVTEQIVEPLRNNGGRIPPEGIHVYIDNITIDEVSGSNGGFDAVIDNWGDIVDIELK